MKKNELMNGDIVVLRRGQVAVVIGHGKDAYLLFQETGFEFLDDYYDDDMIYEDDIDAIMQVFRPNGEFGFEGVNDENPIYERDHNWTRPTEAEIAKARGEACNKYEALAADANEDLITVVSQAFYGNRTGTEIHKDKIDRFILGHLDDYRFDDPIDRSIVYLPGSDKLVLIYNKYQEADRLECKNRVFKEDNYVIKPLARIPELNLEIFSRCIVCRMNPAGELQSLEEGDFVIWNRYLSF